jgi:arginine utilization protein RocB
MSTSPLFARVRQLTLDLVRQPSLTNSAGESNFAQHLHTLLMQIPYYQQHPQHIKIMRTLDDAYERYNIFALVRGSGTRTVGIAGHYDVVSIDNYGDLAPYAYEPDELLSRLIADLQHNARDAASQNALRELQSGDYMCGRGTLDMKSGLAIGIALQERFAQQKERNSNLLLIITPDEENSSNGMRSAVRQLPSVLAEWGVSLEAVINVDAGVGDGEDGRAVFMGSVGKLLPSVYFVGRPTHAGAPFDGINANLMAAELTRAVECNPVVGDLAQASAIPPAPPPVNLYQTDRRASYDVTTPHTAWCAFNVLTQSRAPHAILSDFVNVTRGAMQSAVDLMRARAEQYIAASGLTLSVPHWSPRVLTYAELRELATARDASLATRLDAYAQSLSRDTSNDLIGISQKMIDMLVRESGIEGPTAIVCVATLHYPLVALGDSARDVRLREAVLRQTHSIENEFGTRVRLRPFFTGISDMSFFASTLSAADIAAVTQNTPAWGSRLQFDFAVGAELRTPIINIGPWGADYHQRTERVNMPYSFGVLPELVWRVALDVLT